MNYRIIYNDELYHHGVKGMKWGVRRQRAVTSSGRTRTASRSDNLRSKLSDPKTKERVKKGAKIAAKVLGGAALTYAVVKIPNTKAYIKGVYVVAEKAVKPIPGTKYLYRQAKLADNINRASDYASKGLAVAMVGGTAYKAGKKYKVVERNPKKR